MATFRLALRMLSRDWRAGELGVLIAALLLAVASVGTVGFFADRVKTALSRQANLLLGADVVITGDRPLPDAYADEAKRRGLAVTPVLKFNSMVQRDGADAAAGAVLTDVKAVASGYPLRSAITLVDVRNPDGAIAAGIPPRGEAWPDGRLAARLGVKAGDAILVGEAVLRVGPVVQQEPEVASGLLSLGPRLIVNLDDVPATNLLQPGNRAPIACSSRIPRTAADWTSTRAGSRANCSPGSGSKRCATCAPRSGRRSSAPRNSSASRRWSR